jgi:hypothetical protein
MVGCNIEHSSDKNTSIRDISHGRGDKLPSINPRSLSPKLDGSLNQMIKKKLRGKVRLSKARN